MLAKLQHSLFRHLRLRRLLLQICHTRPIYHARAHCVEVALWQSRARVYYQWMMYGKQSVWKYFRLALFAPVPVDQALRKRCQS